MSKVYILVAGEYSDYHIEGVYETREEAEKWLKLYSLDDYADIEEWEMGERPYSYKDIFGNVSCWRIEATWDTVLSNTMIECGYSKSNLSGGVRFFLIPNYNNKAIKRYEDYGFEIYISKDIAKDKEHALKIFQDKIAEFKANVCGIV